MRCTSDRFPRAIGRLVTLCALAVLLVGHPAVVDAQPVGTAKSGPNGTGPPATPRLTTPVFSARRMPGFIRAPVADARLSSVLDTVFAALPATSCLSVSDHGRDVFQRNAATPLAPASTNKVLTAAAVLAVIPAQSVLSTRVLAASPAEGGVLNGNVWLVGGGDPILTTAGYAKAFEDPAQVGNDFTKLADAVKAAGVTEIRGDVVGDESRYDTQRAIPTWPERYRRQDTVGPLSALMVNDGKTGYATSPATPSTQRKPGDPPLLAAETLKTLLVERGISVTGSPRSGAAPPAAVEIAKLDSLPMREIVGEMLADSDNTTAESLLKELGVVVKHSGTTADGLAAQREVLARMRIPVDGLVTADGSGLDEGNRLTCSTLNALLDELGADSPVSQGFAVAATKGTLRREMRTPSLSGRVLAKTGTLPTVVSLTGFVTTHNGEQLTFALIQNGQGADEPKRDAVVTALSTYPDAPGLDALGPKPVRSGS